MIQSIIMTIYFRVEFVTYITIYSHMGESIETGKNKYNVLTVPPF